MKEIIEILKEKTAGKDAHGIIAGLYAALPCERIVLASSLGVEDQALTHLVCAVASAPRIFTLDTGRLFPETYKTMERTTARYGFRFETLFPDTSEVERLVASYGPNMFYRSVALRKQCCAVRKTHPLKRILSTADAWLCGLRRGQAATRMEVDPIEWDDVNGIIKVNPLFDWTEQEVMDFIGRHDIPINPLQERGFRSVGCQPCTRAVEPDDDIRSGRWWWEEPEHKECGLHNRPKNHQNL